MERVDRSLGVDAKLVERDAGPIERHDAAQLREQRSETAVATVGPERVDQLLPRQRPAPVRNEEREQQAALPPGEVRLDAPPVDLEDEPAAELHLSARQRRANIASTLRPYNESTSAKGGTTMAKQITCECGVVIRGETDSEVMQGARDHMRADHPQLLDQVSESDLRGWIEEV